MRAIPTRPLTKEQQHQIELIIPHVRKISGWYRKKFGDYWDFYGVSILKICRHIHTYDPQLSSLHTWATMKTRSACSSAIKQENRLCFTNSPVFEDKALSETYLVDRCTPMTTEISKEILAGLNAKEKTLLISVYGHGETMQMVAKRMGIANSTATRMRDVAFRYLRERGCPRVVA